MRFFNKPANGQHKGSTLRAHQEPPSRKGASHNSQRRPTKMSPKRLATATHRVNSMVFGVKKWGLRCRVVHGDGIIPVMKPIESLRTTLNEMLQFPWRQMLRTLWRRFREVRLGTTASSLTFTTLLALVPLFTLGLAILRPFPSSPKSKSSCNAG
jgi:hypothetical protein